MNSEPSTNFIANIIRAYDSKIVKAYSWGRFKILRLSFLEEIGQYLPSSGNILDIGCGFGLFSLYYAKRYPNLNILGIDCNPKRIEMARRAATRLSLTNVRYEVGDATRLESPYPLDGAYMLDIIHHIPRKAVPEMLNKLYIKLNQNARLVIKDVNVWPSYKLWFTLIADKMMDMKNSVHYWNRHDMVDTITEIGFEVYYHSMVDILPYPHILYICQKK